MVIEFDPTFGELDIVDHWMECVEQERRERNTGDGSVTAVIPGLGLWWELYGGDPADNLRGSGMERSQARARTDY